MSDVGVLKATNGIPKEAPGSSKDPSTTPPMRLRGLPKLPKGPPRRPKGLPRCLKDTPRRPKGLSKLPKGRPKLP